MLDNRTLYEKNVQDRNQLRYLIGLIVRWKQNFKYARARRIARKRGATIGEGVIMPISLAKRANSNLTIGNHSSIQTNKIDIRSSVTIGSHVIIGAGTEIITTSHNIDSPDWTLKNYGITIEDYVWIPTNVLILPSCRNISYGSVIGSGSVVVKNTDPMSVVGGGNPAKELRKRKCVHSNLIVESLLGGDYDIYKKTRKKRHCIETMPENFNKNKILKNSLLLYLRMLFTMWLNLYATRLVLNNLGVEDMGVYGVVGSIVGMFTIFTSGITSAVQRFLTYELGSQKGNMNNVFCSSLNVIFILSFCVLLLLEIIGVWVLYHKINIPTSSMQAAFWVFQLSTLTCIINMISIPYNALIIAHEKMDAFAFISILQVILNCSAAYCLSFISNERLLMYGIMMAGISILIRIIYQLYCHSHFKETHYRWKIDPELLKSISKFAGISTSSSILQMISTQGITFVINWTFGVTINAVYVIALQLKNSILSFALNLLKAISPQITKTYASGEMEAHKKLIYTGSKMEVFLIYFIMIPFLFRTEYIMKLWLGEVPEYTVAFAQCIVFISLTYAAFEPIRAAVLATNKIAKFMIIPDSFYILVLPVSYFICNITENPIYMIVCIVFFDILTCCLRTYLASKVCIIKIQEMLFSIFLPCLLVASLSCLCCYVLSLITSYTISGFCILLICNSFILICIIYLVGLSSKEKYIINKYIKKLTTYMYVQ